MTEQKHGIDESMDVVNYASAVAKELQKHYGDDGKIDASEIRSTLASTATAGMGAVWGSWDVPAELGELSAEEKDKLLAASFNTLMQIARIFAPQPESK